MNKKRPFLLSVVLTAFLAMSAPISHAEHESVDYGTAVGDKATRGIANLLTAPLELPKNMINTVNDSNIAYGMVGGAAKGILNLVARMFTGLVDLITFPLPTQPIVYPQYVWDDFDIDSTYGPYFRLEDAAGFGTDGSSSYQDDYAASTDTSDQSAAAAAAAAADEANRRAAAAEEAANRAARTAEETNQKLDSMFKKSMMK